MKRVRCAIYTRKSSEDGLEQDFNSLDAQREACEAYIASQKHEGWELRPEHYDDGGISGGHLERPALQQLMDAVDAKQVDQIVVYKIDRLTRSLADFAKLLDRLDAAGTSFVSVTQSFNTATSMGRLTLNMLLSFAQFEREVTAERIRDKIAASKRKGLWMGGNVPFGYQADGRTLKIDDVEAVTIKALYNLYVKLGSVREVKEEASLRGLRTRVRQRSDGRVTGGTPFGRGHLYHILSNPIYAGRIRHKREVFEGKHPAIIEPELWEQVQEQLATDASRSRGSTKGASTSMLAGKMFDETGDRLTPSHTKKNGRRLRYYLSQRLVTGTRTEHPDAWRLPAEQLEALLAKVISKELLRPDFAIRLIKDVVATEIPSFVEKLSNQFTAEASIALIDQIDLELGRLRIQLNATRIAARIYTSVSRINEDALHFTTAFQTRRRGVELKLQLGTEPSNLDRVLVQNILLAQRWLGMILDGKTFSEIAASEGTSKRRAQDLVDLAMLEPSLIDRIAKGDQPSGLTTDYLIRSGVPALWADQSERFALL